LCRGLPSDLYRKHIICLSGLGPLEQDARATGATLHDLQYPRLKSAGTIQWKNIPSAFATMGRLVRLLRQIRPDVLHTMIPVCNVLGSIAGKLAFVPRIVCTKLALGNYRDSSRFLPYLENVTDRLFCLVHCKSRGILEDIVRREPIPRSRMRVIYNGLAVSRFDGPFDRAAIRSTLGIPQESPVIGMIANLIPYKGHQDVLDAVAIVHKKRPDARFVFAGRDNGILAALEKKAKQLGIENSVSFLGQRHDIPELLAAMDILLSASHEEGFSNVLLEAMASSLPVVATDVGGNPEAIESGSTGFIIPPRQPAEIASALLKLLDHPAEAREMGARGLMRVEQLFSYDAMIHGMQQFYEEALQQGKKEHST
jgi:glycosyltransferase involved in cell wall biosynthesis